MNNNSRRTHLIGLIVIAVLVVMWATAVSQIQLGTRMLTPSGLHYQGDAPEEAAVKYATINLRYGLLTGLTAAIMLLPPRITESRVDVPASPAPAACRDNIALEMDRLKIKLGELEQRINAADSSE